ncbi:hypothetical protein ABFX02_08G205000 [Erythranthe guttata]
MTQFFNQFSQQKISSSATQLTIPIMADENSDDHHRDPAALHSAGADTDGGEKCDDISNLITATSSNSSVAEGLYSLISSVMTDFDSRAEATASSQDQLAFSLDRLTGELDKLLEDAPSPFIMQHAARISGVKKRVKALNTVLKSVQRRIDNMDRMLSAGLVSETPVGVSNEQQYAS